MHSSRVLFFLPLVTMALTGCPNPQVYGTPRTLAPGDVQHTIALEGVNLAAKDTSVTLPMLPSYQLRVGVAETLDVGLRLTNMSMLGADAKWNFVRSNSLDLALAPGLQYTSISTSSGSGSTAATSSVSLLYLHAPLLVGWNASDIATVYFTPGVTMLVGGASGATSDTRGSVTGSATAARLGVGAQLRIRQDFALSPEVTALKFFNDADSVAITFGLGLTFGKLPKYGTAAPARPSPAAM